MSTRRMEAKAIITAEDKTGRAFASVAGKMKALDAQTKALNRDARRNAAMGGVLGAAAGILGPAALGAGMLKAVKASTSFERKMYEVEKAANITGAASKKTADEILEMSVATGKSAEDIATMYAAAGYAGRPVQELGRFTEYATKATVAWGTSAEETAQGLAGIANTYSANQGRIEEIGDAINYVADNTASKESDLLNFLSRTAQAGKTAGVTAEQLLALGATYREVNTPTEIAASSMNALFVAMALGDKFMKGKNGSIAGFKELGVNAGEMQKEFAKKPIETMVGFLEKIAKISDPIKKQRVLTELFGKEHQDDINILVGQIDKLKANLGLVADKSKFAGGVVAQFAAQAAKNYFQLDQAIQSGNRSLIKMGDLMLKVGNAAAPAAKYVFDHVAQGAQNVSDAMDGKGPIPPLFDSGMNSILTKGATNQSGPIVPILQARVDMLNRQKIDDRIARIDAAMRRNANSPANLIALQNQRDGITGARDAYDSAQADLTDVRAGIGRYNRANRAFAIPDNAPMSIGSGTQAFGLGGPNVQGVKVEGEATVKQETVVRVEAGSELIRITEETKLLNSEVKAWLRQSNTPGSTGTSSPDVGRPATVKAGPR